MSDELANFSINTVFVSEKHEHIFKKNCIGKFKIKSLWFTIQKKNLGHSQQMHNHPKSTLSGVSYFKVEKNSGGELNLYFQNKKKNLYLKPMI